MCVDKYEGVMEGILARRRLAAQILVGPRGGRWEGGSGCIKFSTFEILH